jgi:hypothetical protein
MAFPDHAESQSTLYDVDEQTTSRWLNRDISALSVELSRLVEKANKERLLGAKMAQLKANFS